jgi:ribonuclease P protein component
MARKTTSSSLRKRCVGDDRSGKHTFSKERRILKRSDFIRLSQKNQKVQNQHFVALFQKSDTGRTRLGITVTKRVGNAVARNQLKRYVREFFRQHSHTVQRGIDINILVKTKTSGIPSKEAYRSLQSIFCKIRERLEH